MQAQGNSQTKEQARDQNRGSETKRVGVIGGGQLAAMMAIASAPLNILLTVQTPGKDDPATILADAVVLGKIDDFAATERLAQSTEVITFENEFVDLVQLQQLETKGVKFLPRLETLDRLVDKYMQRCLLKQQGLPVPKFYGISDQDDLLKAAHLIGFPSVLKARRYGYDGRGTYVVQSEAELMMAWCSMRQVPALLEDFVDFAQELAVMVARSESGECIAYPVVETEQLEQVCHRVVAPARIDPAIALQAQAIAKTIVTNLDAIGIFGIELFLTADGQLSVNEIAPRTHNSGHYTIEACHTSQFEQLLRVVTGMPLGDVGMNVPVAVMINLLGYEAAVTDYADKRKYISQMPQTHLHWYGKTEAKPGRKLGHVTVLADDYEQASIIAEQVETIWYRF